MTRVGVLGAGAIGSVVASALADGRIEGCELGGVLRRPGGAKVFREVDDLDALLVASDLVVEAAGQEVVADYGPTVLAAGVDLLVSSVGALVDDALWARLREPSAGRGRLLLTSGAIGGLDLFRAAALMGPLDRVRLLTTKPPRALLAPWMDERLRHAVETSAEPVTVFEGVARDAVARFPTSVNVAATLALATIGFDRTEVVVVANPATASVSHEILVEGAAGRYEVRVDNRPSDNPKTSAITPFSIIRALGDTGRQVLIGV